MANNENANRMTEEIYTYFPYKSRQNRTVYDIFGMFVTNRIIIGFRAISIMLLNGLDSICNRLLVE